MSNLLLGLGRRRTCLRCHPFSMSASPGCCSTALVCCMALRSRSPTSVRIVTRSTRVGMQTTLAPYVGGNFARHAAEFLLWAARVLDATVCLASFRRPRSSSNAPRSGVSGRAVSNTVAYYRHRRRPNTCQHAAGALPQRPRSFPWRIDRRKYSAWHAKTTMADPSRASRICHRLYALIARACDDAGRPGVARVVIGSGRPRPHLSFCFPRDPERRRDACAGCSEPL